MLPESRVTSSRLPVVSMMPSAADGTSSVLFLSVVLTCRIPQLVSLVSLQMCVCVCVCVCAYISADTKCTCNTEREREKERERERERDAHMQV